MTTVLPLSDHDRAVDFVLVVDWTRLPAEPETGLSANVEVNSCRLVEATMWCGKIGLTADPLDDEVIGTQKALGQYCLDTYREQIKAALLELKPAAVADEE